VYDAARAVYNGAVDRYPLEVARCADIVDVLACVAYARDNVLPLAIRGGAHHGGGFGVWDGALSSISAPSAAPRSIPKLARSVSTAAVSAVMLIMPRERSGWRCRLVSYPAPGSVS
jgi:hypothetical protein